jgi:ABC-type branched-subunit amino acid transport system ATPase component
MPTSSDKPAPRLLAVEHLVAGYNGIPVVSDVSLSIGPGEIAVIIGANGSGKSTLLKAMVGQIETMDGTVRLDGDDITGLGTADLVRRGMGYVPQLDDVFYPLSVAENLEMGGYLLRREELPGRREEVLTVLPALAAMLSRDAGKLSGGEHKMLAIARALMLRPRVLALDEPTANLSPKLAASILHEHVRHLADEGVAIVLVEQRATLALEIADWAHVLVAGGIRLSGPAREILAREDLGEIFLGRDPNLAATGAEEYT